MKKFTTFTIILFVSLSLYSNTTFDYCSDISNVVDLVKKKYLLPYDSISINRESCFNQFIGYIDPYQIVFDEAGFQEMKSLINTTGATIPHSFCENAVALTRLYETQLSQLKALMEQNMDVDVNFSTSDSIFIDDEIIHAHYNLSRENRWVKYLKYRMLQELMPTVSFYDSINVSQQSKRECYAEIKIEVIKNEIKRIDRIFGRKGGIKGFLYLRFINSYLMSIDPHTMYLSEEMVADFQEDLATTMVSFGIKLGVSSDDKIIIKKIIPGSYAWRTGLLNVDDQVVGIQPEGDKLFKTEYAELKEVLEYISKSTSDGILLTVKNKSGQLKNVYLRKEQLENGENKVESFILEGKIKTGYILLPAFYTSWNEDQVFGCAQDVGKAIYQLKKKGIEALILDLRNNGGGAVKEAVELAGIFIDFGTLMVSKSRDELFSMKDFNRGTMYNGPMVVMINRASASASEMVAAILQDYNRALIVGDTSFGKASGQQLLPVNPTSRKSNYNQVKITSARYYLADGDTYQKRGVVPDIWLPQTPVYSDYHESMFPNALSNNSISKKTYYKPLTPLPISSLKNQSNRRVVNSEEFQLVKSIDSQILNNKYLSLNEKEYYQQLKELEKLKLKLEKIKNYQTEKFTVEELFTTAESINFYKQYSDLYEDLKKNIHSDIYIEESYSILEDYIHLQK
ncbi:MAG: carboxy terminal-processing peptidase [Bacteroidales bacterium]|nr:carboxy terminal-processing peptidase [Bacteroidales bacterium]